MFYLQDVEEMNYKEKKLFNEMNLLEQITQLNMFSYCVGQMENIK